jgi:hypothetical protein
MSSWHTYPSSFNIHHRAVRDLLDGEILAEEKIDGSQFSFGVFDGPAEENWLKCKSKGAIVNAETPPAMFGRAVAAIKERMQFLHPGWTYRGEVLDKPKHNALTYARVPKGHIILFDVNCGEESYLSYDEKEIEAERIGFEVVPLLFRGAGATVEGLTALLQRESVLGGTLIEGVVVKPALYDRFGLDKKVLIAKLVSDRFKEIAGGEWKKANPTGKDILAMLGERYGTPARYAKTVQHLRDDDKLTNSVKDIGPLLKELQTDILKECEEDMKEQLYAWAAPHVRRLSSREFVSWYKKEVLALLEEVL